MKIYRLKSIVLIASCALMIFLLVLSDRMNFAVWEQIDFMSKAEIDFTSLGMMAHLPRYLVVSPIYFLSESVDQPLNDIYALYIIFVTTLTGLCWMKIRELVADSDRKFSIFFAVPYLLLFFVSGRFVFGLFGLSLLLFIVIKAVQSEFDTYSFVGLIVAMLFCSVSSGVFIVGLFFLIVTVLKKNIFKFGVSRIVGISAFLLALIPALVLMSIFLIRNISFYQDEGFGIFGLVSHGLGLVLNPDPVIDACNVSGDTGVMCSFVSVVTEIGVMLSTTLLVLIGVIFYNISKYFNFPDMAMRGLLISALGGVFGVTTLFSFIFVLPICINKRNILGGNI